MNSGQSREITPPYYYNYIADELLIIILATDECKYFVDYAEFRIYII